MERMIGLRARPIAVSEDDHPANIVRDVRSPDRAHPERRDNTVIAGHDQRKRVLHPFSQVERGARLGGYAETHEAALAPVWGPAKNLTNGLC
jgi:hypothetical protein